MSENERGSGFFISLKEASGRKMGQIFYVFDQHLKREERKQVSFFKKNSLIDFLRE